MGKDEDVFFRALPFVSNQELKNKSLSFEWSKRIGDIDISGSENKLKLSRSDHFKGFISCDMYRKIEHHEKHFLTVYHCLKESVGKSNNYYRP